MILPCLCCDKKLESSIPNNLNIINQPNNANIFKSYGHYGSDLFDPMNGEYLEINICSECLEKCRVKGAILHITPARHSEPNYKYKLWDYK